MFPSVRLTRRHALVASLAVFLTAFSLSYSAPGGAIAQGTADDAMENQSCRETNCMFKFACNVFQDPWGTENAFWQEVTIIPQKGSGARSRSMVWQSATGEFQPFEFTVEWKGNGGASVNESETVTIGVTGADAAPNDHPNIRFHANSITLCDGFSPIVPFQMTSGGCITGIVYNFDVRKLFDGDEAQCYVGSYGRANSENSDLDAVPLANCGGAVTPWTFQTQKKQNLNCFKNTYIVRYTAP